MKKLIDDLIDEIDSIDLRVKIAEKVSKELKSKIDEIDSLTNVDYIIKQINILRTDEVCEIYKAILDSHHASHLDKF